MEKKSNAYQQEIEDEIPGYKAMAWINTHTEPETKVALLFAWSGLVLDRDYVLGSVEDHTPIRHWILSNKERSVERLKDNGVEFLVVGPHKFIRKSYSFLSDEQFTTQFQEPIHLLDTLLLKEARCKLFVILPV